VTATAAAVPWSIRVLGGMGMEPNAGRAHAADVAQLATTFAPDRDRTPPKRTDHLWLVGFVLVVGAVVLFAFAWFASQRALPSTGALAMKPSPGLSIEQRRTVNEEAAPWVALASLPLLVGGVWLLVKRPAAQQARTVMILAAVLFMAGLAITSTVVDGSVGIGS
jgi:hypothetical protein